MCLINLEIGLMTPPFGLLLFVMKGAAKDVTFHEIHMAAMPFVIIDIIVIGLLLAFPILATGVVKYLM